MRQSKKKQHTRPVNTVTIGTQQKEALLEELGRSPDEYPVFSFPSPLLPWGGVVAAILIILLARPLVRDGPVGILLAAAMTLATFVVMLIPRKLIVGQDGVLFVWMMGSRFIRFRDIDYVEMSDGLFFHQPGINLALKSGRAMDFSTSLFKERWAERDALINLLRIYIETAKSKQAPPALGALSRAGKPYAAWARALLAMGHGAHFDPRAPAVLPEDLLRIAESPDASTIERTAAFVALAATHDVVFEKRLRVALDQTVAPAVRSALREALEAGDDEARIARLLEHTEKMTGRG